MSAMDQVQLDICIRIAQENYFDSIRYYEATYPEVTEDMIIKALDHIEPATDEGWRTADLYLSWRDVNGGPRKTLA